MSHYWNKDCECMSPEGLRSHQENRLKETVKRVYQEVPFYRHAFSRK